MVHNFVLETNDLAKFLENLVDVILLYTVHAKQRFDIPITDEVGLKLMKNLERSLEKGS